MRGELHQDGGRPAGPVLILLVGAVGAQDLPAKGGELHDRGGRPAGAVLIRRVAVQLIGAVGAHQARDLSKIEETATSWDGVLPDPESPPVRWQGAPGHRAMASTSPMAKRLRAKRRRRLRSRRRAATPPDELCGKVGDDGLRMAAYRGG